MRKQRTVHAHYGEYTYEEIGRVLGITKEAVRKIEQRALAKLSHPFLQRKLEETLETIALLQRDTNNTLAI